MCHCYSPGSRDRIDFGPGVPATTPLQIHSERKVCPAIGIDIYQPLPLPVLWLSAGLLSVCLLAFLNLNPRIKMGR